MSRRKNRFKATFTEDVPLQAQISGDENINATFSEAQETIRTTFNVGNGLLYDDDTNTVSADMTNDIEQDSEKLITSGAVFDALARRGIVYSADEHVVGLWLDGKVLYEKTFTFNDVTVHNDRTQSYAHGIEGVENIFVTEAYLRDTTIAKANGNFVNAIGSLNISGQTVTLQWVADDTHIWVNSNAYFIANENRTWRITVRYTKVD